MQLLCSTPFDNAQMLNFENEYNKNYCRDRSFDHSFMLYLFVFYQVKKENLLFINNYFQS